MKGIDVSYHQGRINWQEVKASGVEFAILRAGYGSNTADRQFENNMRGALDACLPVGIYWFLYAVSVADAVKNAEKCASVIAPYKEKIALRIWADWEYDSDKYSEKNGVRQTRDSRTAMVRAFNEHLRAKGYEVGVYANPDYLKGKFASMPEYPLWLAKYSTDKGSYSPAMWQYTSNGAVKGIAGRVDMNILYAAPAETGNPYPEPAYTLYRYRPQTDRENVRWLQWLLNRMGYQLELDGRFGPATEAALKDAQKRLGLETDGKCGPLTRQALKGA